MSLSKNKLIASLMLALSAGFAQADPYQFIFDPKPVTTNDGSRPLTSFSFTVATGANYSGLLTTSTTSAAFDEFSQLSLVLSSAGTSYTIDGSLLAASPRQEQMVSSDFGVYTLYTTSYSFDPYMLDAGDWTATVWGHDIDGTKSADAIALTLNDPPAEVPEPQSLALAGVALAALSLASRRGRNNLR